MNYILLSLSYKKREIGILRALGARCMDVFMIFFLESLMIALICFVLASIGCGIATYYIGKALQVGLSLPVMIFSFGIRQIALILAVSVLTAFAATLLPVYMTAKKKPVEAIRNA
jgi:ABC-type antimicrobial peptide transport system permease subunit